MNFNLDNNLVMVSKFNPNKKANPFEAGFFIKEICCFYCAESTAIVSITGVVTGAVSMD